MGPIPRAWRLRWDSLVQEAQEVWVRSPCSNTASELPEASGARSEAQVGLGSQGFW